jgi:hypothetical protein
MRGMTVVARLDNGQEITFPRIPMEKDSNGLKFVRWQIPLRLVFAGTVHRSQEMTLGRAVVDLRTHYWEHGQLYVALSRVRSPVDLCILLPEDMTDFTIRPRMDPQVVAMIPSLNGAEGDGEMDPINGEHGDPDLADAPAPLDPPDVPGDDEEGEPEQELPELDEVDAFDPFAIAPAPIADFPQDHEFPGNRSVEDMVVIWTKLRQVVHELLHPCADIPFAVLFHRVLARCATEWRQLHPDKSSLLGSRRGPSVWMNKTSIRIQRLLVTYRVRKTAVLAQEGPANHGATAAISPKQ